MNIERKYELQSKRLERMTARANELQAELDEYKSVHEKEEQLVAELENLRRDWKKEIDELKNKRAEYDVLIRQLRIMKKGWK